MDDRRETLIKGILYTSAIIAQIILFVLVYRKGFVSLPLIVYIIAAVVISSTNLLTFFPLFSIAFIILKNMGRLSLGWIWIIVELVIDIVFIVMGVEVSGN